MPLLYQISLYLYLFAIHVASFFNPKAKKWLEGRRGLFGKIKKEINTGEPLVWFHCASLGEFEQGRPVMEKFGKDYPDHRILLTFFSPSGYEVRKNYQGADFVFYLPLDLQGSSKKFVNLVKPSLVVFVKYEFWFNTINYLNKKQIPLIVISAFFRPGQHFFKSYGNWSRKQLKKIDHIFVQNQSSEKLLKKYGIDNVSISGDTRFDRVRQIAAAAKRFADIEKFINGRKVFLAGSSWPPEEEIISQLIAEKPANTCFIFAPHDIGASHIQQLQKLLGPGALKYSEYDPGQFHGGNILIIDSIGILSQLYQYATYAFIGGGFGPGIHNILEATCFGVPVFFGPNYIRFREAVELTGKGAAFPVNNFQEFREAFYKLENNRVLYDEIARINREYVEYNTGATDKIIDYVSQIIMTLNLLIIFQG